MNPIKAIKGSISLLQLENYHLPRFLSVSLRAPKRSFAAKITWTPKLLVVSTVALALQVGAAYFAFTMGGGWIGFLIYLYILSFAHFSFLALATILFLPIDYPLKQYLVFKARAKVARLRPGLKVVAITGSYGKTTTKEVVSTILAEKLRVLKTPENFNTPLGISRFVMREVDKDTDVLVVEMGAYQRGDIRALCKITPPDIAILTGINESHLERFGSLENTIKAKFEILQGLIPSGKAILNADDELVSTNYQRFFKGTPAFYSSKDNPGAILRTKSASFEAEAMTLRLVLENSERYEFSVPFLGRYVAGTIGAGILVAEELGLAKEDILKGAGKLRPSPHRLEIASTKNDVVVIDDSYNGNPDGVREAIGALAQFTKRRKIYVTPGLVEMGGRKREVHKRIGEQLSSVADLVILIRNSVTGYIAEGLEKQGFSSDDIMWFDTSQAARESLPNIVRAGDVILFQNDWPENYI